MADETYTEERHDEVQSHDPTTSTETTVSPTETGGGDAGDQHTAADTASEATAATGEGEPHPLDPDGKRFKQVWARAKTAEQHVAQVREELQREREERIRLEERLKAREETATKEREYTWDELEQAITDGKITRAWAQSYREQVVAKKAEEATVKRLSQQQQLSSRDAIVAAELERYKRVVPNINIIGTPEHQKVEREFYYLVKTLGYPPDYATQLAAARAAVGDIETVEKARDAQRTTPKEPYMETQGNGSRPSPNKKDPLTSLTPAQKDHYEKMIKHGRYNGWEDVKKELEWSKPSLAVKRR